MNRFSIATLSILVIIALTFSIYPISAQSQTQATLSPLKQFKSGIPAQDIICKTGFVLVIKSSNGSPSCIRPATEQRLLSHGWVTPDKIIIKQANHNETTHTGIATVTHQNVMSIVNGIHNTTTNVISQKNMILSPNATDNTFGTTNFGNNITNPKVLSTSPNSVKILSINISPNQLKVGDKPKFTLIYQNVSDKPIYAYSGCTVTPLGLVMLPSDNVLMMTGGNQATCPNGPYTINPNQTNTNVAWPDPTGGHLDLSTFRYSGFDYGMYQITKPGPLHVTMELFLRTHGPDNQYDIMETVQFDVNATQ